MRPERFTRLLVLHGADPARWPDAERPAALELLAGSEEARRRHAEAARLDAALRDAAPPPDAAVLARMRDAVASRIARLPSPAAPTRAERARRWLRDALRPALPAGCGALATLAVCALWLTLGSPSGAASGGIDLLGPAPETLVLAELEP